MFEKMATKTPLAILRCTMVIADTDIHGAANRFRHQASKQGTIELAGNGEERRDIVLIDDVARIVRLVLAHRSVGILNLATGRSRSLHDVAAAVAGHFDPTADIVCTERSAPVTHRHFDITATYRAFSDFSFTRIEDAVATVHDRAFR
jgi:nucleoside-diphosphate-sugar epimerase